MMALQLLISNSPVGLSSADYALHARPRSVHSRSPTVNTTLSPAAGRAPAFREASDVAIWDDDVAIWDDPPSGACGISLCCRILADFASAMRSARKDGWWLSYYTLAGNDYLPLIFSYC